MGDEITRKLGLKIMIERKKRGLSQEKLAELADLHVRSIGAIEIGKSSPTAETLNAIARALEMSLSELVDVDKIEL